MEQHKTTQETTHTAFTIGRRYNLSAAVLVRSAWLHVHLDAERRVPLTWESMRVFTLRRPSPYKSNDDDDNDDDDVSYESMRLFALQI